MDAQDIMGDTDNTKTPVKRCSSEDSVFTNAPAKRAKRSSVSPPPTNAAVIRPPFTNMEWYWCGEENSSDCGGHRAYNEPNARCFFHYYEKYQDMVREHIKRTIEERNELLERHHGHLAQADRDGFYNNPDQMEFQWVSAERRRFLTAIGGALFKEIERSTNQ
jgi:hypothetical protein